jgi:hypothetical protein
MAGDTERAARARIEADVLAWMSEPVWDPDDACFEDLALRLFSHQFEHCAPYARFCLARERSPSQVSRWQEIPAVPTGAFKEAPLCCFPPSDAIHVFRTSGTSAARRGALHLDTLELYEASLMRTIRALLFPDVAPGERVLIAVLAPSPAELPDSSLSHMFGCARTALGTDDSDYYVTGGALDIPRLTRSLEECSRDGRPVALCGTAFAFVHLLDALAPVELPPGSRILETGGFKGRSRELTRNALYSELARTLGVPRARIVNQYGMTEAGSQFYDSVLCEPDAERRKLGPPWARARIVDPVDLADVGPGEVGLILVHDLANTGSIAALATADLGRRSQDGSGFEVLGRDAGAEERGCSIAADIMLGGDEKGQAP